MEQVKVPATAGGKGPEAVAKVEPAMADILFKRPVEVEEVLEIAGEENGDNLTTMEGSLRLAGRRSATSSAFRPGSRQPKRRGEPPLEFD